jgi:DNA repair exonuclease SbcCD ATPase subunit
MSRIPANLQEKWAFIQAKRYSDQSIWVLNGFWDKLQGEAENIWQWTAKFGELDQEKRADGTDLDEFWSHKFLESLGQTMTVVEMRDKFRQIDADFNKRMSMIEYLMYKYSLKVLEVVNASQGENKAEIEEAQEKVNAAQAAVEEVVRRLEEQRAAAEAAKSAAESARATAAAAAAADEEATRTAGEAKAKADTAKAAADAADAVAAPYRAAVAENDAALKELQAQEKTYSDKKAELEGLKADTSLGVVKRNKASNELDQLLAEDPLPLRKAKINQTATLKKMEKAAAPFNEASAKANAAAQEAKAAADAAKAAADAAKAAADAAKAAEDAAREEREKADAAAAEATRTAEAAEEAKRQVEKSVMEAEQSLKEAVDFLEVVKKKGGVAHGAIWWMERTITEKRKYMPASKQKK